MFGKLRVENHKREPAQGKESAPFLAGHHACYPPQGGRGKEEEGGKGPATLSINSHQESASNTQQSIPQTDSLQEKAYISTFLICTNN